MGEFAEGLVGVTLDDRYRLDAVLGEGGMGAVFRATHLALDRKVAVKLLKPHLTGDEAALHRFAREARNALKVDSEHAVKVVDYGVTPLQDYYMVLEYLDGRTVQRELEIDGPFAPARVIHIARQVLHALGAAHRIGLIHRDIKPDNLLLLKQGDDPDYTKVLDFGVSKLMEGSAKSSRSALKLTRRASCSARPSSCRPSRPAGSSSTAAATSTRSPRRSTRCSRGARCSRATPHWSSSPTTRARRRRTCRPSCPPRLDEILQRCLAKHKETRLRVRGGARRRARRARARAARRSPRHGPEREGRDVLAVGVRRGAGRFGARAAGGAAPPRALPRARRRRHRRDARDRDRRRAEQARPRQRRPRRRERGRAGPSGSRRRGGAPPDAAPAPDAAIADAGVRHVPIAPPPRNPELDQHLADYADARRTGNVLKALAAAQLAVKSDPRSARARFAFAEALIAAQNNTEGCKQLRQLPTSAQVTALARSAGCGSD